jgi:hypothetical protein
MGPEFFLPLHNEAFPFQDYWLNNRLTVYSKKYMGTFLYSSDSIESHHTIALRKKVLCSYLSKSGANTSHQPLAFVDSVTEIAAFETVESAYKSREYDLALYHALQLYTRYPKNSYIISRIGKILSDVYEAKNANRVDVYVAKYTPNYCDELKLINSLLYNLTQQELGELALHFLSNPAHFNPQEKNHYYLLWKVSSLTHRNDLIARVSETYKSRFGAGINSYKYR